MAYLPQSVHWHFAGLVLGLVGWIMTASVSGVNDWRIWYVDNQTVITGGYAWVGVWRVCFNSHILDSAEICKSISLTDSFTPPEIAAAQVLCMVAVGVGVIAILVAGDAMRNAIFGVNNRHVSLTFVMAGSLFWVTAARVCWSPSFGIWILCWRIHYRLPAWLLLAFCSSETGSGYRDWDWDRFRCPAHSKWTTLNVQQVSQNQNA